MSEVIQVYVCLSVSPEASLHSPGRLGASLCLNLQTTRITVTDFSRTPCPLRPPLTCNHIILEMIYMVLRFPSQEYGVAVSMLEGNLVPLRLLSLCPSFFPSLQASFLPMGASLMFCFVLFSPWKEGKHLKAGIELSPLLCCVFLCIEDSQVRSCCRVGGVC